MPKDVTVNLKPLRRLQGQIASLAVRAQGPFRTMLKLWGQSYRSFAQLRFDKFSRGGGDWAPLAQSTIRSRRKGTEPEQNRSSLARTVSGGLTSSGGSFTILRDTNVLFRVLDPKFTRKPGQVEEDIPFGIRVGYGGSSKHRSTRKRDVKGRFASGSGKAISDIAAFHQEGGGHLPQRRIIVDPNQVTVNEMARFARQAIERSYGGKA